ncbi:MAG: D-alanine--D-alanine ligase [Kiritimatiellaceae bacterium]|jgi:D-alanine-D-alanine ligase|nr:D-alanine--D-alanine ligase [Kiritimatiellaceae bacterium]|tara:strand:- start:338 stop:1237 length:900 start_codon:yes stop_codon:yes gene_type:complete
MGHTLHTIAVLMGGISSEREISMASGKAVASGLRAAGFSVVEENINSSNITLNSSVDLAFVALHGSFGEDGGIQKQLLDLGIPFTGSSVVSCENSFDKVKTRSILRQLGIPVATGEVLQSAQERTLSLPVVVKPPREGSSVGCHIVRSEEEWLNAFVDTASFCEDVLVEEYIPGRELTVGIVGDQILPVIEISPQGGWYDFKAKYQSDKTIYQVPAQLSSSVSEELQSMAWEVFKGLDAMDLARVDFRLDPDNRPFVLELNAIPGFTESSLLPKAAAAIGISFSELCCRIVEGAWTRQR